MHLKVFVLVCLFSLAFASNYDDYIEEPEYVEKSEEYVEEPDVSIILTNENFAETIKTNNYFVKFYAPWCRYSARLAPTWKQLAQLCNRDEESRVRIAKVDCTISSKTCIDNEIYHYPILQFFNNEETVEYDNDRDLPSLIQFVNEQLGSSLPKAEVDLVEAVPAPINSQLGSSLSKAAVGSVETVPTPMNAHVELTGKNIATVTGTGRHFVKFYVILSVLLMTR
ncbi:unnamed protein product [Diamesa tonsa]